MQSALSASGHPRAPRITPVMSGAPGLRRGRCAGCWFVVWCGEPRCCLMQGQLRSPRTPDDVVRSWLRHNRVLFDCPRPPRPVSRWGSPNQEHGERQTREEWRRLPLFATDRSTVLAASRVKCTAQKNAPPLTRLRAALAGHRKQRSRRGLWHNRKGEHHETQNQTHHRTAHRIHRTVRRRWRHARARAQRLHRRRGRHHELASRSAHRRLRQQWLRRARHGAGILRAGRLSLLAQVTATAGAALPPLL